MADDIKNTSNGTQEPEKTPEKNNMPGATNAQATDPDALLKAEKKRQDEAATHVQTAVEKQVAEAEERKRLKKLEESNRPQDAETPEKNAAKKPAQPAADDTAGQSRFVKVNPKHLRVLEKSSKWGTAYISDDLAELLDKGKVKKSLTGNINFTLNNGHDVIWRPNYGYRPQIGDKPEHPGVEVVSVRTGNFMKKFDNADATAIVAVCKMRGWRSINVHGHNREKEMMWLEAQRQGLSVKNFIPSPALAEKWANEKKLMEADKYIAGASDATKNIPVPTEEDKKGDPEATAKKQTSQIQKNSGRTKRTTQSVGPLEGETAEQYFTRKINNASSESEKEGYRSLAVGLRKGELNIEGVQLGKLLREEMIACGPAQKELQMAKHLMSNLSPSMQESLIKQDLAIGKAPGSPSLISTNLSIADAKAAAAADKGKPQQNKASAMKL